MRGRQKGFDYCAFNRYNINVKKLLIVLVLVLALNLPAQSNYKLERFYLSNGLTVVLSPDQNSNAACVLVYHKTGIRDDPQGLKGASYLYRYLMRFGTRNLDRYERVLFVERNGGVINRKISYDYSYFYQVVPETELNNALWLESERLTSLTLTDQDIDHLKNSDYRGIYNMINTKVNYAANIEVKSKVFAATAYEIPEFGNLEEIRGFNNQEIRKIYQRFRNPAEIILVIAGKFNIESVKKSVSRYFSGLPSRPKVNNKKYNPVRPRKKYAYKNWLRNDIPRSFVMYGIRAPAKLSNDFLYFNFIRYYLVDERISKLEEMLNIKNNLNIIINSEFTNHVEGNALIIKISSGNRSALETAKYVIQKEFDALASKSLTQSELKMTKALMELDFRKDMAVLEKRCFDIAENVALFNNLDFEDGYISRIRGISSFDIMRISKEYLSKPNQFILNVFPK